MAFTWANLNLAKEALKNAQKKIDAVLDIREEDEADSSPPIGDGNSFFNPDQTTSIVSEQPSLSAVDLIDVRSDAATSECDHWSRELKEEGKKSEVIVDTEPNPIHDMVPHSSSSLLNHSPNSSPDEAETEEQLRIPEQDPSEVKERQAALVEGDAFASIPLDDPSDDQRQLPRRDSRHEDEMTVASSDIEVIRHVDAWSMASSAVKGNARYDQSDTLACAVSVEALKGQLRHNEQRIEELTLTNQKMREMNVQLQQRILSLNNVEKTLRKELTGKEAARLEILDEGKRMADYNGKQSREIRRLKAQVADVEKIKEDRKKYKDEKAAAEETIGVLKEELEILKGRLHSAERSLQEGRSEKSASELATERHRTQQEESARRIEELERENDQKDELLQSLIEAKETMEHSLSSMSESELAGRLASERASNSAAIANQEVLQLRHRNEQLRAQLATAGKKLEAALDGKSQLVEAIARASAPLLAEIEELKASLVEERSAADEGDDRLRKLVSRLDDAQRELAKLRNQLTDANERAASEQSHLSQTISKLEAQLQEAGQTHADTVATLIEERRTLQEQLRAERRRVDELTEEGDALRAVASNLESSQSSLRDQLLELRERSLENSEQSFGTATPLPASFSTMTSSSTPPPTTTALAAQGVVESAFQAAYNPLSANLTQHTNAAQSELSSLLRNHELNVRRISELEGLTRLRQQELESSKGKLAEISTMYQELKLLYDALLEMDGEKLEKIEELQHDIVDLRQLIKDQLIAFAEARA